VPRKRARESAKQQCCKSRSSCHRQTCSWFPDLEPATLNLKRRLRFALAHVSLETPARCRNPEWVLALFTARVISRPSFRGLPFEAMFHLSSGCLTASFVSNTMSHINLRLKDLLILGQPPNPVLKCLNYWSTPAMALTAPEPLEPIP
jgi:hypothetical protein